jgi:Glycosyl hydrolase family 26
VYRGSTADIAPVQAYEAFLGRPVQYVIAFAADTPATWAQFEGAVLAAETNGPPGNVPAAVWAPLLAGRQLVLSVPACCCGTTWAEEGAGVNDAHWSALARNLTDGGLGGCLLRVARELNGSWYRWQVKPANAVAYKTAYARIVTVMRDAGFAGTFIWNPYIGQGTMGPSSGAENTYPGDAVVDLIGLDAYDGNWAGLYPQAWESVTSVAQQLVSDTLTGEWDGLRGWQSFALEHGKQLCFPEWGLRLWKDAGVYHGGGDNALLVHAMADWMTGAGAAFHAFWEDTNMGVADPDDHPGRLVPVPAARGAFLAEFGA